MKEIIDVLMSKVSGLLTQETIDDVNRLVVEGNPQALQLYLIAEEKYHFDDQRIYVPVMAAWQALSPYVIAWCKERENKRWIAAR